MPWRSPWRRSTRAAWLYVGLRVAHSVVQATVNIVAIRFPLFWAATLVLLVMTIRTALIVF